MSVNFEEYLPEVLVEVEGCPSKVAENAIRNAIIELCQKARVWRETLDPISTQANVGNYDLDLPSNSQMVTLLWGKHDGVNIQPVSEDDMDIVSGRWRIENWRSETGEVVCFFAPTQETVQLVRIPTEALAGGLVLGAALAPSRDAYEAPESIYNEYLEVIACGAKARLMDMSSRPWYNPQGAAMEGVKFQRGITAARQTEAKNHGQMSNKVSMMRPFA